MGFLMCKEDNGLGCLMKNSASVELDSYFPVRHQRQEDVPKTRFKPRVGKTLSPRRWNAAFSQDGQLDIAGVLRRIQRGGIHPSIKGAVWEFLLGCYDPNSTFEERNEIRQRRREQYAAWKTECKEMAPVIGSGKFITAAIITDDGQPIIETSVNGNLPDDFGGKPSDNGSADKRVIQWKRSLHQIGLDVVRTDRILVFYETEKNQAKLWDILAVYSWFDGDIGYVQGMNDICSPMVILLDDEADAFWCFERAMRRLRENFRCSTTSVGVQSQLSTLAQIIKTIDPKLHQHLDLQLLKWQALIVPEQWQCYELLEQSFGIFHIVNYLSLSLTLTPKLVLTILFIKIFSRKTWMVVFCVSLSSNFSVCLSPPIPK
nr:TBC1 domain family member 15 isoform X3 [Coffea arabica]